MGTIRIDFGSKGGSRAVRQLKTFNTELDRSIDLSNKLGGSNINDAFSNLDSSQVKRLVSELKKLEQQSDRAVQSGGNLTALGIAIKTQLVDIGAEALRALGRAITESIGFAIDEFGRFEAALASFEARSQGTNVNLESLEEQIKAVAQSTSFSPAGLAEAATQLVALGVPATEVEARLESLAKTADVLGEDPVLTGRVLQGALEQYSDFGETAESVSDVLVTLINTTAAGSRSGIAEFEQLFSRAAPAAANLGIEIEVLGAAFAGLRQTGATAQVAATTLDAVLTKLATRADELSAEGIELQFTDDGGVDLEQTLLQIRERIANLSEVDQIDFLASIFGENRGNDVLALINSLDGAFGTALENASNATGNLNKSFEIVSETLKFQAGILQGQVATAFTVFGQAIAPIASALIELGQALITTSSVDLGPLTEAAERFNTALTDNPETVETLSEALSQLAQTAVDQFAQIVDSVTAFVSEEENIEAIAQTFRDAAGAVVALGEVLEFAVGVFSLFNRVTEGTNFLEKLFPVLRLFTGTIDQARNAAAALGQQLERLGIIKLPEAESFGGIQSGLNAAAEALDAYNTALENIATPEVPGAQIEDGSQSAEDRAAEIEKQTQDELFAREQAFDREKFNRDKQRENEIADLKEQRQQGIDNDRRNVESELNQLKLEGEQRIEDLKLANERQLEQQRDQALARVQEKERQFQQEQQEEEERFREELNRREQAVDREVALQTAENPRERRDLLRQFEDEDREAEIRRQIEAEQGIQEFKDQAENTRLQKEQANEELLAAERQRIEDQFNQARLSFERDVLQPEKIALEELLNARKLELLAPIEEAEKALEDDLARIRFENQQEEQRIQRKFDTEQETFKKTRQEELNELQLRGAQSAGDELRNAARDAKDILESTTPPISGAQSGGAPVQSLRGGGTLQPREVARVHKDEYIAAGMNGATVVSQVRSRAISAAALRQANDMRRVNEKVMMAVAQEVRALRVDIAKRQVPRLDQTINSYGVPAQPAKQIAQLWDVRF